MWLLDIFKRKKLPVTAEGVPLPAPGDTIIDEIQLCRRCTFKGSCTFENGCTSLRMALFNRIKKLTHLRGVKSGSNRRALREGVVGFGWKTISRRWKKSYRICGLNNDKAIVRVLSRSEKDRRETTDEYDVEIPFVVLLDGREMVDYTLLKEYIINRTSSWSPGK